MKKLTKKEMEKICKEDDVQCPCCKRYTPTQMFTGLCGDVILLCKKCSKKFEYKEIMECPCRSKNGR